MIDVDVDEGGGGCWGGDDNGFGDNMVDAGVLEASNAILVL